MIVFADTNVLIYLIEQPIDFGSRATARIDALVIAGDRLATSELVRMECRIGPLMAQNSATLGNYDRLFTSPTMDVFPITRAVCDRASAIRAQYKFRPLDALHLAAAVENHCNRFLTNDLRLKGFSDVVIEVLP